MHFRIMTALAVVLCSLVFIPVASSVNEDPGGGGCYSNCIVIYDDNCAYMVYTDGRVVLMGCW